MADESSEEQPTNPQLHVVQDILTAQNEYIRELEQRLSQSDNIIAAWQQKLKTEVSRSETKAASLAETVALEREKFHDASTNWKAERSSLVALVESSQKMLQQLQATIQEERIVHRDASNPSADEIKDARREATVALEREAAALALADGLREELARAQRAASDSLAAATLEKDVLSQLAEKGARAVENREISLANARRLLDNCVADERATFRRRESALCRELSACRENLARVTEQLLDPVVSQDGDGAATSVDRHAKCRRRINEVQLKLQRSNKESLGHQQELLAKVARLCALRDAQQAAAAGDDQQRMAELESLLDMWEAKEAHCARIAGQLDKEHRETREAAAGREAEMVAEVSACQQARQQLVLAVEQRQQAASQELRVLRDELAGVRAALNDCCSAAAEDEARHIENVNSLRQLLAEQASNKEDKDSSLQSSAQLELAGLKQQVAELQAANEAQEKALALLSKRSDEATSSLRDALSTAVDALESNEREGGRTLQSLTERQLAMQQVIDSAAETHAAAEATAAELVGGLQQDKVGLRQRLRECQHESEATASALKRRAEAAESQAQLLTQALQSAEETQQRCRSAWLAERERLEEQLSGTQQANMEERKLAQQVLAAARTEAETLRTQLQQLQRRTDSGSRNSGVALPQKPLSTQQLSLPSAWQQRLQHEEQSRQLAAEQLSQLRSAITEACTVSAAAASAECGEALPSPSVTVELTALRRRCVLHQKELAERDALWLQERQRLRAEVEGQKQMSAAREKQKEQQLRQLTAEVELLANIREHGVAREGQRQRLVDRQLELLQQERVEMRRKCEADISLHSVAATEATQELSRQQRLSRAHAMQQQHRIARCYCFRSPVACCAQHALTVQSLENSAHHLRYELQQLRQVKGRSVEEGAGPASPSVHSREIIAELELQLQQARGECAKEREQHCAAQEQLLLQLEQAGARAQGRQEEIVSVYEQQVKELRRALESRVGEEEMAQREKQEREEKEMRSSQQATESYKQQLAVERERVALLQQMGKERAAQQENAAAAFSRQLQAVQRHLESVNQAAENNEQKMRLELDQLRASAYRSSGISLAPQKSPVEASTRDSTPGQA